METHPTAVLLVEDDLNVSRMLKHFLARRGYAVTEVSTIAAAREKLATNWDVMILDRHLPDGDGIAFCAEVRRSAPFRYVLMLTGDATPQARLQGFAEGADDFMSKPFELEELVARVNAGGRIVQLQKALLESNRKLEEMTLTDALTSVRNRRAFDAKLADAFGHAHRYDRPLSLLMIDIDHFKQVNDTYGHQAGDEVLRAVARLIESATRHSDFVARVGGEELAAILPESALFDGIQVAEKIRVLIEESRVGGQLPGTITVSIGVASIPYSAIASSAALFEAADQALYRAKSGGRNRVEMERRKDGVSRNRVEGERRKPRLGPTSVQCTAV